MRLEETNFQFDIELKDHLDKFKNLINKKNIFKHSEDLYTEATELEFFLQKFKRFLVLEGLRGLEEKEPTKKNVEEIVNEILS